MQADVGYSNDVHALEMLFILFIVMYEGHVWNLLNVCCTLVQVQDGCVRD
jgi:hypothetical protein